MAVTGPIMIATMFTSARPSAGEEHGSCAWQQMIDYLDRHHQGGPADDIVLTYNYLGPVLVWQTGYDVVGAPYGNAEALTDTRQVLMARSDGAARAVIERRGIDLIVVCRV